MYDFLWLRALSPSLGEWVGSEARGMSALRILPDKSHGIVLPITFRARAPLYTFGTESKTTYMESPNEKKFVPKGAMAFFILLILLTLAFFYGIYLLKIDRV